MIIYLEEDFPKIEIALVWFRRDLRLEDNTALSKALSENENVLPLFIFDADILDELPANDPRVSFIYAQLKILDDQLRLFGSSMVIGIGKPLDVWKELISKFKVSLVYFNKDYEPYANLRDEEISQLLEASGIESKSFKDHVVFEESEVVKNDGRPYTVFTPYKRKWLSQFVPTQLLPANHTKFCHFNTRFPSLVELGFEQSRIRIKPFSIRELDSYDEHRNFPAKDSTSYLGPHLRYGTVGVRQVIRELKPEHETFLSELVWREFFIQILHHYPQVITRNFRSKYDGIQWRNNSTEFELWCNGKTGYPMVDAGMRQLNETGYMHNRVRMVVAGFLCKHLLIDWKWGEAYFAKKLLDYDLASNNGNWQWAAGTGCDAAPYFRIFNPSEQLKKFDANEGYARRWIGEYGSHEYPTPMVDHRTARQRALQVYKDGIG